MQAHSAAPRQPVAVAEPEAQLAHSEQPELKHSLVAVVQSDLLEPGVVQPSGWWPQEPAAARPELPAAQLADAVLQQWPE